MAFASDYALKACLLTSPAALLHCLGCILSLLRNGPGACVCEMCQIGLHNEHQTLPFYIFLFQTVVPALKVLVLCLRVT